MTKNSVVREDGTISMILSNKNCAFIKRVAKTTDGYRTQKSWYFSFANVIDDPRSLQVGMPVTFLVDTAVPVSTGKSPIAMNVEIIPAIEPKEVTGS